MPTLPGGRSRTWFLTAVTLATVLAAWLRIHGITGQVVLDDEWHAIHKLLSSSYAGIFTTFGWADHSIPLTLLYKAIAETVGLAEGRMRAPQVASGIALVPIGAWLAWRASRDAAAAALFAFLLCGAPFLVMWSRFARPYAITLLLTALCVAAIWRWRTTRTMPMAACAALTAALSAWLHPIAGVYAAIGCVFVFLEDVAAPAAAHPRPSWRSLRLGAAVALAMLAPLVAPLLHDRESLSAKAGGDQPNLETLERMLAIYWGGVPTPVMAIASAVAAWGVVAMFRRDARLTAYLLLLAVVPAAALTLSGAMWVQSGQNFGRYVLPLQPLLLFFGSVGATSLVRLLAGRRGEAVAWVAAATLSGAYLYATPAIAQVARLGPWYGHLDYHWDYRHRWNEARHGHPQFDPPAFYRRLARMAPGSAPLVEAPFIYEAPFNQLAYYATFHRQPVMLGMIHDLCLEGPRLGEPAPGDRRLRFRKFVFLSDASAVRRTGARYLLVHRGPLRGKLFDRNGRCVDELARLYGPPLEADGRLAVFDLKPGQPPAKLQ